LLHNPAPRHNLIPVAMEGEVTREAGMEVEMVRGTTMEAERGKGATTEAERGKAMEEVIKGRTNSGLPT
jgi:hypothetical protein